MSTSIVPPAKVTIINLDGDTPPLVAQLNPKELSVDKTVAWQKKENTGGDQPHLQFSAADGRIMSFELWFDTYETAENVHAKYVQHLIKLAMVRDASDGAPEDKKRPPRLKVVWGSGALPAFEGVLESVGTKYTMFLPDGTPVRATCTVKLKEASAASFKAK